MGELGRGEGRRHRHLFPPQTMAGLASLADFFSRHRFFFSFSPNVEPGPRLQKWKQDYNVCIELYGRPVWIYSHFDSDILSE